MAKKIFTSPQVPLTQFSYDMLDAGSRHINPFALPVAARDLGHALQKIAAALADDCVEVRVWRSRVQPARKD